ncbi:hypothetical protein [Candidatus Magnetominusculus dajiuhuensis]|uniref:hypothetical protein n=1 Tax=Candidatus Magnetominusculus dajiuhuensis TaxID=3137712 RepID=UPI003B437F65
MKTEKAEQMRIRYKYRTMIMKGKVWIHYKGAARLIGPDCAFHLYSTIRSGGDDTNQKESKIHDFNPGETV